MTPTLALGLGVPEALIVLLVTLGILTFWGVVIWHVVQIMRGVVQIVRPPRSRPDPNRVGD